MADADFHDRENPPVDDSDGLTAAQLAAMGVTLGLAACGGGGGTSAGPATPPAPAFTPPSRAQAARFLGQATMGSSKADIDQVVAQGFEGWLDAQFAMPRPTTH